LGKQVQLSRTCFPKMGPYFLGHSKMLCIQFMGIQHPGLSARSGSHL